MKGADGKSAYAYAVEGGYTGTEEEFAAKLAQEKFANPNALTFTGAVTGTYNGSAPLTVTIPSGGGGGSSENPMRLVRSLTLTEAASAVNIDTDDYGNSFTLKECYLYVKAVVESEGSITYIPNGYWIANTYVSSLQKAVTSYAYPFIFHAFGTPDYFWGYEVSSKGAPTGQAYNAVAWDKASYCNYITLFRVNGPFAADARFYLFGRDA